MDYFERLERIEEQARGVLNSINSLKMRPFIKDENYYYIIDYFYESVDSLGSFLVSMRKNGYLGKSPHNQDDLEELYDMIQKLEEINRFVEKNYQKNIDYRKHLNNRNELE